MPVSENISAIMEKSSWIRKMFEEGARLKAELGEDAVFDFTLGNPVMEPPDEVRERLKQLVLDPPPGASRYMPNAGLKETRDKVAGHLAQSCGLPFTAEHILMTVGAGGALNVIIKALADPDDEVVIAAPFFAEYMFYASNHQATVKVVQTDERFGLIPEAFEEAIGPKTRIVLLNSPNNPTGAVYPEQALRQVGDIIESKSAQYGRPVYLVMDEPYRKLTYEGVTVPDVFGLVPRSIVATSHSKDLNLPGERIGYIAIGPENEQTAKLAEAMALANRILGFVNAPALFQRLAAGLQDLPCDMAVYTKNRDTLVHGLRDIGYRVESPGGGFYLFPKCPIADDVKFVAELRKHNVLVVPGAGFGRAGYFRIAFCCDNSVCERALPGFREAYESNC